MQFENATRAFLDSDTGQGNRHDVWWVKMQLSLYVIENEAARGRRHGLFSASVSGALQRLTAHGVAGEARSAGHHYLRRLCCGAEDARRVLLLIVVMS